MFKKLAQQLKNVQKDLNTNEHVTLPFAKDILTPKNEFFKAITQKAVDMYERQCDINNIKQIILSNPENTSHNMLVADLFQNGVTDPFLDDKLTDLADNKKFLKDLGLM